MPIDGFYDIIQNLRKSYNLLPSYDQKRRLTIWRLSASFNYFIGSLFWLLDFHYCPNRLQLTKFHPNLMKFQ